MGSFILKIAIVSRSNRTGGGASKVAEDLTKLLRGKGHYVHHYRRDKANGYNEYSSCVYGSWEKVAKKVYYKLKFIGFQEIVPFELKRDGTLDCYILQQIRFCFVRKT